MTNLAHIVCSNIEMKKIRITAIRKVQHSDLSAMYEILLNTLVILKKVQLLFQSMGRNRKSCVKAHGAQ